MKHVPLILASTSTYRADLLRQLGVAFEQVDPAVEEQILDTENPAEAALRLSREKAVAGARICNTAPAIIIGSDQVAHQGRDIFRKPGNFENARQQLSRCSGQWISFSTAVSLADSRGNLLNQAVDHYDVRFRSLSQAQIRRYLEIDQPFDCAGSIKAEALGITLIEETRGKDINTLYGLPLIDLVSLLASQNIVLPLGPDSDP